MANNYNDMAIGLVRDAMNGARYYSSFKQTRIEPYFDASDFLNDISHKTMQELAVQMFKDELPRDQDMTIEECREACRDSEYGLSPLDEISIHVYALTGNYTEGFADILLALNSEHIKDHLYTLWNKNQWRQEEWFGPYEDPEDYYGTRSYR